MGAAFGLGGFQDDIARQRLRHACAFSGVVEQELGAGHPERIEDVLLFELIQRLAGYDLDDAADHVGRMAVTPERSGLPRQRQSGDPIGKRLVVVTPVEKPGFANRPS